MLTLYAAVWRTRAFPFFCLWTAIAALPSPLETGVHALAERFAYLPGLPLAILLAQLVFYLRGRGRAYLPPLGAMLVLQASPLPLTPTDPVAALYLILGSLAIIAVLTKAVGLDWRLFACAFVVMLFSQLQIYTVSALPQQLWQPGAAALCLLLHAKRRPPLGLLLAIFAWPAPAAYFLLLTLATSAFSSEQIRVRIRDAVQKQNAV